MLVSHGSINKQFEYHLDVLHTLPRSISGEHTGLFPVELTQCAIVIGSSFSLAPSLPLSSQPQFKTRREGLNVNDYIIPFFFPARQH